MASLAHSIERIEPSLLSMYDLRHLNSFDNRLQSEIYPDDPLIPFEMTAIDARHTSSFVETAHFWIRDSDGSIAGSAGCLWRKGGANRHLLRISITVRPDQRRRGIAMSLLSHVVHVVRQDGHILLIGATSGSVPAGEMFAKRMGAEPGLSHHTNRLLLSAVPNNLVTKWTTEIPHSATAYRLLVIDGAYPNDRIEVIAALHEVMNTAPRDDLRIKDERMPVDILREIERRFAATGAERWSMFLEHIPTGEIVGFTEVMWEPQFPQTVWQLGTAVELRHRGHNLGKWLKASMFERIMRERPQAVEIRTSNADSNDAMLAINRQLGFTPLETSTIWQVEVARIQDYLALTS